MKSIPESTAKLLTALILTATAFTVRAEERSISEKTREAAHDTKDVIVGAAHGVGRAARIGWHKTKAFFSDELPAYHEGAHATLASLAKEIFAVKARTPESAPAYFRTRLLALDQQHEYLSRQVSMVTREHLRDRAIGARYEFDRCIADLEAAIDQAENGADMFIILVKK
jgi:hypothetical protein